jgi:hypothetical protein
MSQVSAAGHELELGGEVTIQGVDDAPSLNLPVTDFSGAPLQNSIGGEWVAC